MFEYEATAYTLSWTFEPVEDWIIDLIGAYYPQWSAPTFRAIPHYTEAFDVSMREVDDTHIVATVLGVDYMFGLSDYLPVFGTPYTCDIGNGDTAVLMRLEGNEFDWAVSILSDQPTSFYIKTTASEVNA